MKEISDAIVIGSGIIGSATAFGLSRAGMRRISVVEKGPLVSGMTRRNAGLVHPFFAEAALRELAVQSYSLYSQWAVHFGGKSPFVETGAVLIAPPNGDETGSERAQPGASALDSSQLAALFPGVSDRLGNTRFTPQAGYADAVAAAQTMVNTAKERGAQVHTGTNVKQILVERGQIKGVVTTTGTIEAPVVIVAAGGWSERLLLSLGMALRLRFRPGLVLFYEQPPTLPQGHPMLLDEAGGLFLRPHPYHMSAAGSVDSAMVQGVDVLDEYVNTTQATRVARFVADCVPAFGAPVAKRAHTIVYDTPVDGLPLLGRVGTVEGLYAALGFGTSAFAVAPAVGQTLARMLLDGTSASAVAAFDPQRAALRRS